MESVALIAASHPRYRAHNQTDGSMDSSRQTMFAESDRIGSITEISSFVAEDRRTWIRSRSDSRDFPALFE